MFKKIQHIHFIGIGGAGMSGIAEVLLNLNYKVSGSDLKRSEVTERLESLGAKIFIGHDEANVENPQVVVYSTAVNLSNPEILAAKKKQIPVIRRAEMLAELMRMKYGIAVAGTHGKTTTTSMVAAVLVKGGLDPTVVIGGRVNSFGSNAMLGKGDFLVAEADESDGSFLRLSPTIAVVTTLDCEHMDFYKDLEHIKETFLAFINKIPFYGVAVLCLDQEHIQSMIPRIEKRFITYGLESQADFIARDVKFYEGMSEFEILNSSKSLGKMKLRVPGLHNIYNSLAATAVGLDLDIDFSVIREALEGFSGVQRRFQIKGEVNNIIVVDDYGHHPTEIKATLSAAKSGWNRRTIVVFQPHRYTRTYYLLKEFSTCFYQADILIITDIYPAGEKPIEGIKALDIVEGVKKHGHKNVIYVHDKSEIPAHVMKIKKHGDMVITLGAGDIGTLSEKILDAIREMR